MSKKFYYNETVKSDGSLGWGRTWATKKAARMAAKRVLRDPKAVKVMIYIATSCADGRVIEEIT